MGHVEGKTTRSRRNHDEAAFGMGGEIAGSFGIHGTAEDYGYVLLTWRVPEVFIERLPAEELVNGLLHWTPMPLLARWHVVPRTCPRRICDDRSDPPRNRAGSFKLNAGFGVVTGCR